MNKNIGMIDISGKNPTKRTAMASCKIKFSKKTFNVFLNNENPKGDALETAKIAGIMAAKSASAIIPMCHPIGINKATITFKINKKDLSLSVFSHVICEAKTGAEMEAMTAVSVAALTVYDMMKWADKGIIITDLKLLSKSGGKSGNYVAKDQ